MMVEIKTPEPLPLPPEEMQITLSLGEAWELYSVLMGYRREVLFKTPQQQQLTDHLLSNIDSSGLWRRKP
jgi:hypothetical protein